VKDFRDLQVWQKAHLFTLDVYRCTSSFPKNELYGLTGQLRRSAASIPANIAEGCGRATDNDFWRFLQIAMGSASESEYHLLLAKDLQLFEAENQGELTSKVQEIKRMLASLILKLNADR